MGTRITSRGFCSLLGWALLASSEEGRGEMRRAVP